MKTWMTQVDHFLNVEEAAIGEQQLLLVQLEQCEVKGINNLFELSLINMSAMHEVINIFEKSKEVLTRTVIEPVTSGLQVLSSKN